MKNKVFFYIDPEDGSILKKKKKFYYSKTGKKYYIIRNIPRFVKKNNYAQDFGLQWIKFSKTQLDSYNNFDLSYKRLRRCFGQDLKCLNKRKVLEAGSGAGRFTEILLKYNARVHSFDYSVAVEANLKNNKHKNLYLCQADIRKMPFKKNYYDFVVCLGVLQHTPSSEKSIGYLWEKLKPGGKLVIDHYLFKLRTSLPPPFGQALNIYRFFILFLPLKKRFKTVKFLVNLWFPLHWKFRNCLIIQRFLRRLSPVIFHYGTIKLKSKTNYYNWSLLDTHDSLTDFYKHKLTKAKLFKILKKLDAKQINITYNGNGLEARCLK